MDGPSGGPALPNSPALDGPPSFTAASVAAPPGAPIAAPPAQDEGAVAARIETAADDDPTTPPRAAPADPWAALLEAGSVLLQGLAAARAAEGAAAALSIERDPLTGQASVRLPLPDAAVLHRLARAFEPWLRQRQE